MRSWIIGVCVASAMPIAAAHAADGRVGWPTFFRVGPSKHHEVVDELFRGTIVNVRSCDTQWCLVQYGRALGYVERAALNTTDFPPASGPAGSDCFDSTRSGYGKGEKLRFCRR